MNGVRGVFGQEFNNKLIINIHIFKNIFNIYLIYYNDITVKGGFRTRHVTTAEERNILNLHPAIQPEDVGFKSCPYFEKNKLWLCEVILLNYSEKFRVEFSEKDFY